MELKAKQKLENLSLLLSKPDSYSIEVVNEESDNGSMKKEKQERKREHWQ